MGIIVIAVSPAVCEEAIFRGYLYSSLNKKMKPVFAILISALVFGIYHLSLFQGCFAFAMGIILATVLYITNSIFATAIIHFICNAFSVMSMLCGDDLVKILPFMASDSDMVKVIVFIISALVTALGFFLLIKTSKKNK